MLVPLVDRIERYRIPSFQKLCGLIAIRNACCFMVKRNVIVRFLIWHLLTRDVVSSHASVVCHHRLLLIRLLLCQRLELDIGIL
jgi:hypothetical protein